MKAEPNDIRVCPTCHGDVLQATTDRKSQGKPVKVLVEVEETQPEHLNSNIREDYIIGRHGDELIARQPTSRAQRAAMIAHDVRIHQQHTAAICKRKKTARR